MDENFLFYSLSEENVKADLESEVNEESVVPIEDAGLKSSESAIGATAILNGATVDGECNGVDSGAIIR